MKIVLIDFKEAKNAFSLNISSEANYYFCISGVYRDIKARTGFKIDLFVNELTLEPPSTGNSTDTN